MGRMILVTGGARSGKSTFAEELCRKTGDRILYIATSVPFDSEMRSRIEKHRRIRPSTWQTWEAYSGLGKKLPEKAKGMDGILLDCVTVMATNMMMDTAEEMESITEKDADSAESYIDSEISSLVNTSQSLDIPMVLVTNEVGMGIVPDNPSSRFFRDIAGRINQKLAKLADEVYLCVSGIPVRIKPGCKEWKGYE